MAKITITITPQGDPKIEADGYVGTDCKEATLELEKLLGMVADEIKKPEYDQKQTERINQGM